MSGLAVDSERKSLRSLSVSKPNYSIPKPAQYQYAALLECNDIPLSDLIGGSAERLTLLSQKVSVGMMNDHCLPKSRAK